MRCAVATACLIATAAGCGDNAPACGHVEVLDANRNIWGGHIAVNDDFFFYSDYDFYAAKLVLRQPLGQRQAYVVGAAGTLDRLGFGMAVDATNLYWATESDPVGYTLFATPLQGGPPINLTAISECTALGIAVDAVNVYAGAVRCNNGLGDIRSRVVVTPLDNSGPFELWNSAGSDVSAIAARDGIAYLATTAGLVRVDRFGTSETLDGRPSYHAEIDGDELYYSTQEAIIALPLTGGPAHTVYSFRTSVDEPRAFAVDDGELYISEPPQLVFVAPGREPESIVRNMGATITHMVAHRGQAYWATLAMPESIGLLDTFSGGVMRVSRPCD